jgi:2-methylcitrate dehydratase PrpD
MDAIATLSDYVLRTRWADLSAPAVRAARSFILDSLGVGVAGSAGPWADQLVAVQGGWGAAADARNWGRGAVLPAPAAAMCNAYQVHNAEFDCVHEAAVVHPMAVLLPAALAQAERQGGVDGRQLVLAVVLGVDVACRIGLAARTGLRFFRPGSAGAFAATAAVGRLMRFDADTLVNAMGITLAQLCGTMQAHLEGSPVLALQVGFNARNAVMACDMAARGLVAPHEVLEGRFGYFKLFEGEHDRHPLLDALGQTWRITEVAHKPFPSGRATHGIVDAVLQLKQAHGFAAAEVAAVACRVPPLVTRLVGRPVRDGMAPNYARLCAAFVAARALLGDTVRVEDFAPAALGDAETLALARRFEVRDDAIPDPNALTPVTVEVRLDGGARHQITLDIVYGNPGNPMTREAHLAKFRRNWRAAAGPLPAANAARLIDRVDGIESLGDVREIVDLLVP